MKKEKDKVLTPVQSGMPINSITLDLTTTCCLACSYCFAAGWDQERAKKDLDFPTAMKIIDWLFAPSTSGASPEVTISFWGGEPLMKFDLMKEIIEYAEAVAEHAGKKVSFGGTTNVVMLTEDKFDYLDKHKCYFLLSIDGIQKHHDANRVFPGGCGSWKTIDQRATKILERWPFAKVRMSYTAEFIHEFFDDIMYLYNKGFRDIAFSPVSEGDWTDERLDELKRQLDRITDWYLTKKRAGENLEIKAISDAYNCVAAPMGDNAPCGAGRQYVGVTTDGSIYPCVPPGTLVKKADGEMLPIEQIRIGDYVYTHRNRKRIVTNVMSKKYEGYVYSIRGLNSPHYTTFTPEHPVYTKQGWKNAGELKVGDQLLVGYNPDFDNGPDISYISLTLIGVMASLVQNVTRVTDKTIYLNTRLSYELQDTIRISAKMLWPQHFVDIFEPYGKNECEINSRMLVALYNSHFNKQFINRTVLESNATNLASLISKLEDHSHQMGGLCRLYTRNMEEADLIRTLLLKFKIYPFITKNNNIVFFRRGSYINNKLQKYILPQYQIIPIVFIKKSWYNNVVHNLEVYEDNSYSLAHLIAHNCHRFNKFNDNRPWQEKEMCLGHIDHGITNQELRERFVNWSPDRDLPDSCKTCKAYKISCTGGCWATNLDNMGDIALPTKVNCEAAKYIIDVADRIFNADESPKYDSTGCTCYNACYLEGTPFEMQIINKRDLTSCRCNGAQHQT